MNKMNELIIEIKSSLPSLPNFKDTVPIRVEPCTKGLRNIYLKLLYRLGYLSLSECYKFTATCPNKFLDNINQDGNFFISFTGLDKAAMYSYEKERINKNELEFYAGFSFEIDNIRSELKPKDGHMSISFDMPLRFTTLFTYNNIRLMIILIIIGYLDNIINLVRHI